MANKTTLIPELAIGKGVKNIDFYKEAFGAIELWRINNPDGSVHVAAFSVFGSEFRLHEERIPRQIVSPANADCTTMTIGLSVDDVSAVANTAILAGAQELSPVTDYEYGYRQGEIKDPFGHHWIIEKLLSQEALDQFIADA